MVEDEEEDEEEDEPNLVRVLLLLLCSRVPADSWNFSRRTLGFRCSFFVGKIFSSFYS